MEVMNSYLTDTEWHFAVPPDNNRRVVVTERRVGAVTQHSVHWELLENGQWKTAPDSLILLGVNGQMASDTANKLWLRLKDTPAAPIQGVEVAAVSIAKPVVDLPPDTGRAEDLQ